MRTLFLVFTLITLSVLSSPEIARSQSSDTAFPEVSRPEPKPEEKISPDAYDIATDEEITEAQRFYESCASNDTMSKQKDCRCAAASYLETRIKLGKAASVEEIMKENINTCLIDGKTGTISDVEKLGLENVTEQQMKEAEEVYKWCEGYKDLRNQTDCECLAARFLDLRMKRGPLPNQNALVIEITQKECRNIVETTGMEYSMCMKGTGFNYFNIRPKDYCECYARTWGELFESYPGRMDENKKSSIRLAARSRCKNPQAYKRKR